MRPGTLAGGEAWHLLRDWEPRSHVWLQDVQLLQLVTSQLDLPGGPGGDRWGQVGHVGQVEEEEEDLSWDRE